MYEEYTKFTQQFNQEFTEWNEKQPPESQILNRVPFTTTFPTLFYKEPEFKKVLDKKDNTEKEVGSQKAKMKSESGREIGYKVQSPSVIAPRGYTRGKTKTGGEVESIGVIYDLRNPEHRQFYNEFKNVVTQTTVHMILRKPGAYKIDSFPPITVEKYPDVTTHIQYSQYTFAIENKFAKTFRLPTIDGTNFDHDSPLRYFYFNPMYYQDEEDPTKPPSVMRVTLMTNPNKPPLEIDPKELMTLCAGITGFSADGKPIISKRKGFECSPEMYIQKLHIGAQLSIKCLCSAITVTRFFLAPVSNTQEGKIKYLAEHGVHSSVGQSDNPDESYDDLARLLDGLRSNQKEPSNVVSSATGSFNPMADTQIPQINTQNSFIGGLTGGSGTPPSQSQTTQAIISSPPPTISEEINKLPNFQSMQQVQTSVPPPSFQIPNGISGLQQPMSLPAPAPFSPPNQIPIPNDRLAGYTNAI